MPIADSSYYFGDIPQYNCSSSYTQGEGYKCGIVQQTGQWEGTAKCQCEFHASVSCNHWHFSGNSPNLDTFRNILTLNDIFGIKCILKPQF